MCKVTFTAIEQVALETPYGTVRLLFESPKKCVVLLPDEHTEPPTPYLTIEGVQVKGSLVFGRWDEVWFELTDERSRCYEAETDCWVSDEQSNELTKQLSSLLLQWVKANPNTMTLINRSLDRQAIERFQAEIDQLNAQIDVLVSRREAKQRSIWVLQKGLDEETTT